MNWNNGLSQEKYNRKPELSRLTSKYLHVCLAALASCYTFLGLSHSPKVRRPYQTQILYETDVFPDRIKNFSLKTISFQSRW